MENEKIEKLLEDNFKLTQEIHQMVKSIKSYILWQQIFSFIKILLIVVPLIIGIIYLPPLLKQAFGQYQELLGLGGNSLETSNVLSGDSTGIQGLLEQYRNE